MASPNPDNEELIRAMARHSDRELIFLMLIEIMEIKTDSRVTQDLIVALRAKVGDKTYEEIVSALGDSGSDPHYADAIRDFVRRSDNFGEHAKRKLGNN